MDTEEAKRPKFRGCLVCYGAEMAIYGASRLRTRLAGADGDGSSAAVD